MTLRVLQASCGALLVASLAALGEAASAIPVDGGAATIATVHPAVPTEWARTGPLAIPTIGVVPPGLEGWFDPSAERTVVAHASPSPLDVPVRSRDQPTPEFPAGAAPVESSPSAAAPTPTTKAAQSTPPPPTSLTTSLTTSPETTTPQTTTPQTTSPEVTTPQTTTPQTTTSPQTTSPEVTTPQTTTPQTTTTPETTTPETTTPPTTTPPTTTPPTTTPETPPTTDKPAPTPPPVTTNKRGNTTLAFGEKLTVLDGVTGAVAFTVSVDSLSTDVICTDPKTTPAVNGRLIAVQVRVTTGSDLSAVGGHPAIRSSDFRFLAADGVTLVGAGTPSADTCLPDTETFPAGPLSPDKELTGTVVLDVPAIAGTIAFTPAFLTRGAEWAY